MTDPVFELSISLPPRGSRDLLRALHGQLKAAILDGRLQPGLRLPATRALADGLGVSRNTAVAAYDLLLSEGYLVARPGSGTYVGEVHARRARAVPRADEGGDRRLAAPWRVVVPPPGPLQACRHDFRIGIPDPALLPLPVWRRLSARAMRGLAKLPAAYAEPQGRLGLRQAIASHVSFARAVACAAEDVVVTSGAQQAFDLLARILVTPGRSVVAVEEPGYPPLRAAFAAMGARVVGVPVDGEGLCVERLPAEARVICVTPSHQFPLGVAMSPQRRKALLEAAQHQGAVVLEDDYDGEFRFGGRPLDALQTLDRGDAVFYVGTFSKSLFPGLRIGFVVAPAWAREALVAAKRLADWQVPVPAQDTLAAFIAEGHLARHVRRMRQVYGERREALLDALARHAAGWLTPIPSAAGLHLSVQLAGQQRAAALAARALQAGIGVQALEVYMAEDGPPAVDGLLFGYGAIRAQEIEPAVRGLAKLL